MFFISNIKAREEPSAKREMKLAQYAYSMAFIAILILAIALEMVWESKNKRRVDFSRVVSRCR